VARCSCPSGSGTSRITPLACSSRVGKGRQRSRLNAGVAAKALCDPSSPRGVSVREARADIHAIHCHAPLVLVGWKHADGVPSSRVVADLVRIPFHAQTVRARACR